MPNKLLGSIEAELKQLQQAIPSRLAPGSTLHVGGEAYTPAQLSAQVDRWLSLFADSAAARVQWAAAVAALRAELPAERAFVRGLRQTVTQLFGPASSALPSFGIKPPRERRPLAPGQKVLAAAKAKATRKLRGIMGRKQRLAIPSAPRPTDLVLDRRGETVEPVEPVEPAQDHAKR